MDRAGGAHFSSSLDRIGLGVEHGARSLLIGSLHGVLAIALSFDKQRVVFHRFVEPRLPGSEGRVETVSILA
jgi:hypothetical protein